MRLEYIVVSIILMLIVFVVITTLLSGVVPGIDTIISLFRSRG